MTRLIKITKTDLFSFRHSFWCNACRKPAADIEILRGTKDQSPSYPDPIPVSTPCSICGGKTKFSSFGSYPISIRQDTGEEVLRTHKLPGAIYEEPEGWYDEASRSYWFGPDGRCLTVICPDGTPRCIDSRASNCDKRNDATHRCWTRPVGVDDALITVNKSFGPSCNAGAGSIVTSRGHWFLTDGVFVTC